MKNALLKFSFIVIGLSVFAPTANAKNDADAKTRCEVLENLVIPDLKIKSVKVLSPEAGQPEYCRVTGFVGRAGFELRLPTSRWNGKYYMAGCGSFCGTLRTQDPAYKDGISRGYATIVTDAGHQSWTPAGTKWARDDQEARTDHAWRAIHNVAVAGRQITQAYYGFNVKRAYFNGCSNGGRQGLMEAARFPDDFDGILAEAPAQNVLSMLMVWTNTLLSDTAADGKSIFNAKKMPLVQRAVAKACGDADGVVSDPQNCKFDPAVLQCAVADSPDCLSAADVSVLRAWYGGPSGSADYENLGGVPFGSEVFWTGRGGVPLILRAIWPFMSGGLPIDSVLLPLKYGSTLLMRDVLATPAFDSDYNAKNFDPARDLPRLKKFSAEMSPSSDLRAFKASGGKLLITQGTADVAVPPAFTIDYWRKTQASLGTQAPNTVRMFMVPGMGHCGNGDGPRLPGYDTGDYDPLTALEKWVEQGIAPDAIIATRRDESGRVTRSEPLCALPARAVYLGKGDRANPQNWLCR
ncbi:tannase/feruloyl esterase family alpha/beta hydrolase [Stenotrophobium rhamnosiphilum]|uniref:tannase/feruloyl esterase family alpha/beta hydrolase n=1 Tax=Stenotrophobium rhamnosiphilum TaxID=2029166 RepID=UPI0013752149|nr:tannase/feruloyl esterase family alpha/beta hydrolase [Stenotrophobium rhamnosiphilum]